MSNFFNMDNGFFRTLGKLADLMILNILFIVCSIPIFTIGASLTAMYYVTLKMAENEDGYIARSFFKSFRQNFRQATVIWLIMLLFGIVLVLDLLIMKEATGTVWTVFRVIITATGFLYLIMLNYVFPVLARFYNNTKAIFKNSFIMAIADFPRTFVAFAHSFFLKKIFAKYMPKEEEEESSSDGWSVDEMPASIFDDPDAKAGETAEAIPETDAGKKDESESTNEK